MSVVLPKRMGTERIYPNNTTAVARGIGTVGTTSTWTQIVAGTSVTADFVMMGAYIYAVYSEGSISFSGDIPFQLEYGTGAAASEVQLTSTGGNIGVQYTGAATSTAQIGFSSLYRFDPVFIGSGSRIAVRATGPASHILLTGHYVVGYEPGVVGYPHPRPWDQMQDYENILRGIRGASSSYAPSGTQVAVTTPGTQWIYSASSEIITTAATDLLVTGVDSSIVTAISLSTHAVVDVGVGANGAEDWLASVALPGFPAVPGPGGGLMEFVRPVYVKQGERVAVRVKGSANKTWGLALVYSNLK